METYDIIRRKSIASAGAGCTTPTLYQRRGVTRDEGALPYIADG